jgi:hypothetical protein
MSQDILHLSWNLKVHDHAHSSQPLDPILTKFMKQSASWEADSHSDSQGIPCLLLSPKAHYRVHKSPPQVSVLGQMNSVHTFPFCFFNLFFLVC